MENKYISPSIRVVTVNLNNILSGSISSNKDEIGYGGRDKTGSMQPSSLDLEFEGEGEEYYDM